jgi:hypothetical protein
MSRLVSESMEHGANPQSLLVKAFALRLNSSRCVIKNRATYEIMDPLEGVNESSQC